MKSNDLIIFAQAYVKAMLVIKERYATARFTIFFKSQLTSRKLQSLMFFKSPLVLA